MYSSEGKKKKKFFFFFPQLRISRTLLTRLDRADGASHIGVKGEAEQTARIHIPCRCIGLQDRVCTTSNKQPIPLWPPFEIDDLFLLLPLLHFFSSLFLLMWWEFIVDI